MLSLSPSALRSRHCRARKRDGIVLAPVEVQPEALEALVECGFLEETDRRDRAEIGVAVAGLLEFLSEGALTLDPSFLD